MPSRLKIKTIKIQSVVTNKPYTVNQLKNVNGLKLLNEMNGKCGVN